MYLCICQFVVYSSLYFYSSVHVYLLTRLTVCLSSSYLYVQIPVCQSTCLTTYLPTHWSVYLSFYLHVYLFTCPYVSLSIYIVFIYLFVCFSSSCCCCCCRPHSTNVLPAESSTRNHVAASSLSPQVARKGSTLSG